MSILQTKRRPLANTLWRFPRGPLEINHADPFSKHLQAFFIVTPTGLRDLVRQVDIPLTQPDDIRPNSSGNLALHYAGAGFDNVAMGFEIDMVGKDSAQFTTGFDPKTGTASGATILAVNASNYYIGFDTASGDIRSNFTAGSAIEGTTIAPTGGQSNFIVGGVKVSNAFNNEIMIAGHGRGFYDYAYNTDTDFVFKDQAFNRLWINTSSNTYSIDHFAIWFQKETPEGIWPEKKANQLMRDPTRVLRPYTRRLFIVPATGGGGQTVATGLITENESLFSASPSPGATSVAPGQVTENESLFSATPALSGGDQSASTGLLTEEESLFSASPDPGAVAVAPGLLTEEEVLFSATVDIGAVVVPVGLLTEEESLFSATVDIGAVAAETGLLTEEEVLFPALGGAATSITISAITGGQNLASLSYCVFDSADIGAGNLIKQGNDETTDANGDLVIDLTGLGVSSGTTLTVVITNYTLAPDPSDRAAVCYADAEV